MTACAAGRCVHCSAPTETFINCCNVDCNKLHLTCPKCAPLQSGTSLQSWISLDLAVSRWISLDLATSGCRDRPLPAAHSVRHLPPQVRR